MANIITTTETFSIPENGYIFKHSTACPVSHTAYEEVKNAKTDLEIFLVKVIEQRPLSNKIAEELQIKHQSPQLIKIKNGIVDSVWNHSAIRTEVIK